MRLIDADKLIARLNYCVKEGLGETIAHTFRHMIEDAPTENEWIPVSERLPKKDGWYLVTIRGYDTVTDVSLYSADGSAWSDVSTKQKAIAWMPLPEPYRGDTEETR